jgi:heptosyltransferase-2
VSHGIVPVGSLRRIAIRFPNWLGDTVMAVPTLRSLRAAAGTAEVWCLGPWVETVLETEPGIARRLATPAGVGPRLAQARGLRRAGIDLAVVLPNSFETALAAWLTGARWRVGYAGEARASLLTHAVSPPGAVVHQVDTYLRLLDPLGVVPTEEVPRLTVSPERRDEARRLLAEVEIRPGHRTVGLQLGAAMGPAKLWSPDRLAALATRLEARGLRTVFLGAPGTQPLLDLVTAARGRAVRTLVGRDRRDLLAALIAQLTVLVSADSGPAHVAAAVGVPAVTLFGPTDPRLTAPRGPRQRALWHPPSCAPCFLARCPIDHRCLRAIEVLEVEAAVLDAAGQAG